MLFLVSKNTLKYAALTSYFLLLTRVAVGGEFCHKEKDGCYGHIGETCIEVCFDYTDWVPCPPFLSEIGGGGGQHICAGWVPCVGDFQCSPGFHCTFRGTRWPKCTNIQEDADYDRATAEGAAKWKAWEEAHTPPSWYDGAIDYIKNFGSPDSSSSETSANQTQNATDAK